MTWPIAGQLGRRIPASAGDTWVHLWTFRWLRDAIFSGSSPYFTDLLFYPDGVSLLFHNIAWVNFAAWLPLQALVGEDAAYSLVFMAAFVANGFATYLLARDITGSKSAAVVAGLVVAFWPYALSHHNHPNLILIAGIPLALLYVRRFLKGGKKRDALFAALFIAFIGITRWQLLIMAGLIIGLYVLYTLVVDKESRTRRTAVGLLAVGLLSTLIMAPLMAPVVAGQLTREDPEALFVDEELCHTDLLAYLVPSRYHPLWGDAVFTLYENFTVNKVFVPFIGYTVLALAVYGVVAAWPRSRFWLLVAILFIVFALGPSLAVNGRHLPVPLPYALVADSFIVKLLRRPDRFNVILSIPIAILVALGISILRQRIRARSARPVISAVLVTGIALLILGEYIVRYPTFELKTPPWYAKLAQEPGDFGILDIPMSPRALPDKSYMYYQFTHGKPLVEGHVSRPPSEAYRFIDQVPVLAAMRATESSTPEPEFGNVSEQLLRQLSEANIRYLILHEQFLSDEKLATWKEWLIQQPVHEDDDLVVYRTDPELGRDFAFAHMLTFDPDGRKEIGLVRATVSPTSTSQGGSIQVTAAWASASDVQANYDICLSLISQRATNSLPLEPAQTECRPLSAEHPTSQWRANELVATDYTFEISSYLESGDYSVTMALVDSDTGLSSGDPVALGDLHFSAFPRTFTLADPSTVANITWDDLIFLPGYDLSPRDDNPDELAVTLYWQALDRMEESYTLFLHLIDPASGEIAAQADTIPRGWSYPTNWWERGESIEDTVRIPLENVPAGEYDLYVGWYDMETGERLPAFSESGEEFVDHTAFLTTVER